MLTSSVTYLQLLVIAAPACLAVEEFLFAPHTTDATLITVKLLFCCLIIKEDAFHARVDSKCHVALLTLCADWLLCVAQSTHKLFHILPLQLMPLHGILHSQAALELRHMQQSTAVNLYT